MIPMIPPTPVLAVHKDYKQINFQGGLNLLKSHKVWSNFAEISSIYRESGHNGEISKYLEKRLQNAGFDVKTKRGDGTIYASRGLNKTKSNAIILQAHMDIVSISRDGNPKKPIEMNLKDGWLYANDRTLGADNGLGMSAMLAVAEDARFKKYPLEMIITTNEETGMDGAKKLNAKDFYGKYLINLDTEKYGEIVKGCAGISEFSVREKIKMIPIENDNFKKIKIELKSSRGGHSAEITPESINPIKVLVSEMNNIKDLKLVSLSGGERYNSIPRDASAEFLIPKENEIVVKNKIKEDLNKLKQDTLLQNPDLDFAMNSDDAKKGTEYVEPEFQVKMFEALNEIPTGLLSKFDENGYPKTSQNLGVLKISDGDFQMDIMGRSADNKEGQELQSKTSSALSKLFEKPIDPSDNTPIWQPQNGTLLENAAVNAYSNISNGAKPIIKVEHGGLESAVFMQKKPDLEQISIGPTIEEPHSIQERVEVSTVLPFYNWLSKILQILPK